MVTTDSEAQQAAYVKELQLPYLLYCDERRTAVELLGIPTRNERGNVNAEPTAFAVSIDGESWTSSARRAARGWWRACSRRSTRRSEHRPVA